MLMKLQSEDEGFEQIHQQVIHIEKELIYHYHHKLPAGNNLIAKRISNCTNSIFTNIALLESPMWLDLPFEENCTSKLRDHADQHMRSITQQPIPLQQYLYQKKLQCVYNKYQSRVNYNSDMTSIYRDFDHHLDYATDNYRAFTDSEQIITPSPLQFCSNFESGNLMFVYKSEEYSYELVLNNDINSHGYTQWFYFRIRNKLKCKAKFVICNLIKPAYHFRNGMKVSIYSSEQKRICNRNWFKGGDSIRFYKNNFLRKAREGSNFYYSLEFSYNFDYIDDTVYFAMNIPFTYTHLLRLLNTIEHQDKHAHIVVKRRSLSYTISNNDIQLVEVYNERANTTKAVVITARQHPCQSVSSFVVQGILQFLVRDNPVSLELLSYYRFYILPMVNPDGVVHGNSRLNLNGFDINRQWLDIDKNLCNEAYVIYSWILRLSKEVEVEYLLDLHGHSKKFNTFGYFSNSRLQTKAFANTLSEFSRNYSYESCTFGISQDKQKTFRSLVHGLGIPNSITIETSYFGRLQNGIIHTFTNSDLHEIGETLLKTIHKFINEESVDEQIQLYQKADRTRQNQQQLIYQQSSHRQILTSINQNNERSDSDPEGDYLNAEERIEICSMPKKKISSSRENPKRFQQDPPQSKLDTFTNFGLTMRQLKPRTATYNQSTRRWNKSENARYSAQRYRTQPDEYIIPAQNDNQQNRLSLMIKSEKSVKKYNNSFNATGLTFKSSQAKNLNNTARKFSAGNMNASHALPTTYPTSMAPYLSRFIQVQKSDVHTSNEKQRSMLAQGPEGDKRKEPVVSLFNPLKYPNRLLVNRFMKKREDSRRKRSPTTLALLKQVINISSYGKL